MCNTFINAEDVVEDLVLLGAIQQHRSAAVFRDTLSRLIDNHTRLMSIDPVGEPLQVLADPIAEGSVITQAVEPEEQKDPQ